MFKNNVFLQFVIIAVLSLGFGFLGAFAFNKIHKPSKPMIYSLNLRKVIELEKKNVSAEELKNPSINPKNINIQITKFVKDINSDALKIAGKNGVIIVKQAVIGGSAKDITVKVEQMLTKQGDL
jgi:hypothetical protein